MSRKLDVSKMAKALKIVAFKEVTACCRKNCYAKVFRDVQEDLFNRYSSCVTKIQQDHVLALGLHSTIPKTRVRKETYKVRELNWIYKIHIPEELQVCKKFYMSLYQVSTIKGSINLRLKKVCGFS